MRLNPDGTWTTYRRADGQEIAGEYAWVDELEWFEDDDDQPTELIAETWSLVRSEVLVVNEPDDVVNEFDDALEPDEDETGPTEDEETS